VTAAPHQMGAAGLLIYAVYGRRHSRLRLGEVGAGEAELK
jgi:hypothetical protein